MPVLDTNVIYQYLFFNGSIQTTDAVSLHDHLPGLTLGYDASKEESTLYYSSLQLFLSSE